MIGILSFKLRGAENLNFVIPINYARGLLASTESFGLEDFAKRVLGASADLFAPAQSPFPRRWKSLSSGTTKIIRVEGEHLYVETVLSDKERAEGAFHLSDLTKSGERYVGHGNYRNFCSWVRFGMQNERVNRCDQETFMEITLFSPTRIEGFSDAVAPNAKFDCGKCQWNKAFVRKPFTWIPE